MLYKGNSALKTSCCHYKTRWNNFFLTLAQCAIHLSTVSRVTVGFLMCTGLQLQCKYLMSTSRVDCYHSFMLQVFVPLAIMADLHKHPWLNERFCAQLIGVSCWAPGPQGVGQSILFAPCTFNLWPWWVFFFFLQVSPLLSALGKTFSVKVFSVSDSFHWQLIYDLVVTDDFTFTYYVKAGVYVCMCVIQSLPFVKNQPSTRCSAFTLHRSWWRVHKSPFFSLRYNRARTLINETQGHLRELHTSICVVQGNL